MSFIYEYFKATSQVPSVASSAQKVLPIEGYLKIFLVPSRIIHTFLSAASTANFILLQKERIANSNRSLEEILDLRSIPAVNLNHSTLQSLNLKDALIHPDVLAKHGDDNHHINQHAATPGSARRARVAWGQGTMTTCHFINNSNEYKSLQALLRSQFQLHDPAI